jgi:DNA-binding SARP family transcriptional activator
MNLSTGLEVGAQALSAVLAVWLGLTVASRTRTHVARVFALLTLVLATWSTSIVIQRMTVAPAIHDPLRAVEELMAALGIASLSYFALAIATDGRPSRRQMSIVVLNYAILVAFATPNIIDPGMPVTLGTPHFSLGPIPGWVVFWAWVVARLEALALGAGWLLAALRPSGAGAFRRRQLLAALATVLAAGIGASLRFLPVISDADRWIGTSFVTISVVTASYAVFAAGIFFGPTVAARAFRASVIGAVLMVALVTLLAGIELVSETYLGLAVPFVPALGLVAAVAVYGPVTARFGGRLSGGGSRALARDRLLRALGEPPLTARPAGAGVHPALIRLALALDLTGVWVVAPDGSVIATAGDEANPDEPSRALSVPPIPLLADGEGVGELHVGKTASGGRLGARDVALLALSAEYIAGALRTGRREEEQTGELSRLAEARADVEVRAATLHTALVEHRGAVEGVRVFALGPLRVERGGERIVHWGGDKAGSRQAQGLFAFLYDRGERGVTKDEVLELIWPDTDLERADLAFHRTMNGLRSTLDPHRRDATAVQFASDRYRLGEAIVAWSDVDAFHAVLDRAAVERVNQVPLLEEARRLYRGDYLDDCPYYGDSAFAERRRALLRSRFVDLVVSLGERYEAGGDRISAAAAFRDAIQSAPEGCPPAIAGLARLGL